MTPRDRQYLRREVQDRRDPRADQTVRSVLRRGGRGGDDADGVGRAHQLGQLVDVADRHPPDHRAHLGRIDVDHGRHGEAPLVEPGVVGGFGYLLVEAFEIEWT